MGASSMPATLRTRARMPMPFDFNSCIASAPAKHSGAVSRPENCPPPRMSLWPANFTAAV